MKIAGEALKQMNCIFEAAYRDNRNTLFEHEIYKMLDAVGVGVPKHIFTENASKLTREMLAGFPDKIVVKIVSSNIAHKQKLGGVKMIMKHDLLFVQYVLDKMKEEVLSHFEEGNKPTIDGFLIVEFVEFTQSIGYEILIGIKDDSAFGPVLTLSKGGDDAEFFAKYYDPANLFLPHFTYDQALELVHGLNIRHKFNDIGHPEYLEFIAKAASLVSALAYYYSAISGEKPLYHIKSLDINPFVITKDNRFVAVDGYATFEKVEAQALSTPSINMGNIEAFFKPRNVAVLGVTSVPGKYSMAREIAQLMHDLKREDLYLVNPKGGTLQLGNREYTLYPSLEAVPVEVDLVVYAAPARHIYDFFKRLGHKKPRAVILIPGIPADISYQEFCSNLREVVPEGIRVVGPNCMGVYYGPDEKQKGINTLFIDEKRLQIKTSPFCNSVLLTQSGGIAITLIDKLKNTPALKSVVSFGNKFDVKITDLISYFDKQEEIKLIALYIEGFSYLEGRVFYELAQQVKNPLVVYKGGRTEAGAKAAASHTASMTGDYDVFMAACRQANAILTDDIKMFYDFIKGFSLLSDKNVSGRNTAGVLNAGFEATIASDELGCLQPAVLSEETREHLREINTHGLADVNASIIDVTPMTDDVLYGRFIEALLNDKGVESLIIGILPHVENLKATPENCHDADSLANIIVNIYHRYDKPIVVSVNAGEYYKEFVGILEHAGIPVFSDIRSAVRVLDAFVSWKTGVLCFPGP